MKKIFFLLRCCCVACKLMHKKPANHWLIHCLRKFLRLKWFSNGTTDSLHNIAQGKRELLKTENSHSEIQRDSKGRIVKITRLLVVESIKPAEPEFRKTATLEFKYSN